ncbi:MAG: hypothetical protein RIS54_1761 [Verrucomicrobiota bacterium]|jgi:hypothetical protein
MPRSLLPLLAFVAATVTATAAPVAGPTAVHTQPNADAAVLKVLSSGTTPEAAPAEIMAATPAGWTAVQIAGPFEGYVRNGDIDKGLKVKPGASIHLQPSANAGVLTIMKEGDTTKITGLHGKWTQITLDRKVVGYIRGSAAVASTVAAAPILDTPRLVDVPGPTAGPPARATASAAPTYIPAVSGTSSAVLPRLFQGKFVSTRRPFTPRRQYDWQINDAAGVRYAYLDISKLLLTEQIEKYADREVVVYGVPSALADGKNIVIKVESLRLK